MTSHWLKGAYGILIPQHLITIFHGRTQKKISGVLRFGGVLKDMALVVSQDLLTAMAVAKVAVAVVEEAWDRVFQQSQRDIDRFDTYFVFTRTYIYTSIFTAMHNCTYMTHSIRSILSSTP